MDIANLNRATDSKSTRKQKLVVPEFIISKITNRKLNTDKYFQWINTAEIYMISQGKKSPLYVDSPIHKTDEWEDVTLFGQLLSTLKPKTQVLVMHICEH